MAGNSLSHFHRRHYEAIAKALQDLALCADTPDKVRHTTLAINIFSELLASDNSQFKLGRFERACVPGANVRARSNGAARGVLTEQQVKAMFAASDEARGRGNG